MVCSFRHHFRRHLGGLGIVVAVLFLASMNAWAISGLNDAPVLDATKSPALNAVFKGAAAPSGNIGTPVSVLVDLSSPAGQVDNVTDADDTDGDGPAQLGIAITAADASNGTWYFYVNNTWTALGTPSASSARLLAANSTTRLYFQPNAGFSGTVASALTFRAWDRTTGTSGGVANTSTTGGTNAFSTATDTASILVIPEIGFRAAASAGATAGITTLTINKPTGTIAGDVMLAAIAVSPSSSLITAPSGWSLVSRRDQSSGGTQSLAIYVKVAGTEPSTYSWSFPNSSGSAGGIQTFTGVDTNNPIDVYSTSATASSATHTAPSVTPRIPRTMLVTWHAFNSAATWTPPSGMTEAVDKMSESATGSSGVSLEGNYLFESSSAATGTKSAVASNNADVGNTGSLALRPANSAPVLDATYTPSLSNENEDAAAPSGSVGSTTKRLADLASVTASIFNVSDNDADTEVGIAIIGADSANGTWYYSTDSSTWTLLPAVSDNTALLLDGDLYFKPNTNFNGTINNAITFRAWDKTYGTNGTTVNISTTGGSTAFSTASDTASILILPVNDGATASNLSAAESYTEDTALNLIDIIASDIDSTNVIVTLTLSNPAAGSLSTGTSGAVTSIYNPGSGTWSANGAIADVNTLLAAVLFTPATNFNGNFSMSTSVSDGVAAAVTGTKNFTGISVNDAPTATNLSASETYTKNTPLNLINIVISDVDSTNVTATLTLSDAIAGKLTTGTSGSVTSSYDSGTGVWTASGALANVNVLLAGVTFVPASNFYGSFSMTTSVSDSVAAPVTGSKAMTGVYVPVIPVLAAVTNQSGNSFAFTLTGEAGAVYNIETSINLTNWSPWKVITNSGQTTSITNLSLTNSAQFYRALLNQ